MAGSRKEVYIKKTTLPALGKLEELALKRKNSLNAVINAAITEYAARHKK